MLHSKDTGTQSVMSKRRVGKALAETLDAILVDHGFLALKGGYARRYGRSRIDVIQVENFNRASHLKWGTTPYSFALPVGFFLTFAPSFYSPLVPQDELGNLLPGTTICHVRGSPKKHLLQRECDIPNIWYVDPDGRSFDDVLRDVRNVLEKDVIPWFDRFSDLRALLQMLREDPDEFSKSNDCWGWGGINSPVRLALTGFLALELEQWNLAAGCFRGVLEKGGLAALSGSIEVDHLMREKLEIAAAHLTEL